MAWTFDTFGALVLVLRATAYENFSNVRNTVNSLSKRGRELPFEYITLDAHRRSRVVFSKGSSQNLLWNMTVSNDEYSVKIMNTYARLLRKGCRE